MAQILNMNQCIQSQSRNQYRLGYFLSLSLRFSTVYDIFWVSVSDSVPFRIFFESRSRIQYRLREFWVPDSVSDSFRHGQDPGFGTELEKAGTADLCEDTNDKRWALIQLKRTWLALAVAEVMSKETNETWFKFSIKLGPSLQNLIATIPGSSLSPPSSDLDIKKQEKPKLSMILKLDALHHRKSRVKSRRHPRKLRTNTIEQRWDWIQLEFTLNPRVPE